MEPAGIIVDNGEGINGFDDFESRLKVKALAASQPAADDADQIKVAPAEEDEDVDERHLRDNLVAEVMSSASLSTIDYL